jgi:hypothetical protein
MALDISPVLPLIDEGGKALIGCVVTAILAWIGVHVRNALFRQAIDMAVRRAGGLAYDALASAEGSLSRAVLKNQAIEKGVNYMLARVPGALKTMGVKTGDLGPMVKAELGTLLAVDPTVTVIPLNGPSGPVEVKPNGQPKVPLRPHVRP